MNIRLKITIIILLILFLVSIFPVIKKRKLSMKYGVFWSAVLLIFIIMTLFPNLLTNLSDFFGFEKVSNMLFLIGYFVLTYFVFVLYSAITKLSDENKKLIQEISILKYEKERNEKR